MEQFSVALLLEQSARLGLSHVAGPVTHDAIRKVEVAAPSDLSQSEPGTLVILSATEPPPPYVVDVALRRAAALGVAGLVFALTFPLGRTATALATRLGLPVLMSEHIAASDLAVAIDRVLTGGAAEAMTRASYAIEQVSAVAAKSDCTVHELLECVSTAVGTPVTMRTDPTVSLSDSSAVFIGEVPIGSVEADPDDPATAVTTPIVATLISRVMQREHRNRFAPTQSRAELLIELVLAEPARVDAFTVPAARLGLPLHLQHAVAWLRPHHSGDPDRHPSYAVAPAVELFTLQLVEERPEQWHIAHIQDDFLLVCTEASGSGDHQRRLRDVAVRVQQYARTISGEDWSITVGLGTPQSGASGLRQSAAAARVAVDSALAAGRPGGVEIIDETGLQRVLLDFYASPIRRTLLQDILAPLDALGPEQAEIGVRTLLAYLANRNSLARAGAELMLHPNAVGYRMRWIREALGVDLDDTDARFAVELACRVRLLGAHTSRSLGGLRP